MMAAGNELAEAASQALGQKMKFEDIFEYVRPSPLHHTIQKWYSKTSL